MEVKVEAKVAAASKDLGEVAVRDSKTVIVTHKELLHLVALEAITKVMDHRHQIIIHLFRRIIIQWDNRITHRIGRVEIKWVICNQH